MQEIKGVYTALVTPINADGKVDEAALTKLIDFVIDNGTTGLVVLGGTGEYNALTAEQRCDAVKYTIAANKKRVPVVAGVIGPGLPEAISVGNACKNLGVDALMAVTPYYVLSSQQGIYDYYTEIMKNVDLPLVLYNIPSRTGVNMLPDTIEKLLDNDKEHKIVGMKECSPNMAQVFDLLLRVKDRISVLTGEEFLFYPEVSFGGKGGILASSNIMPKAWTEVYDCIVGGRKERAVEILSRMTPVLNQVFAESNPGPLKDAMKMIGIPCGEPLLPLKKANPKVLERLEVELKKFNEWYK